MKKIVLALTAALIFGWQGPIFADSSVDALIQKLKDKGILTDQEATQLQGEISSKEQTSQQTTFKSMLPDWVQNVKLTGDMRLRFQYQRRADRSIVGTTKGDAPYYRGRVRARLNFEDQVNDKLKVIFGIATDGQGGAQGQSGVNFARSNNMSFGGNVAGTSDFGKDEVVVNRAYAKYTPNADTTIMAGKMDNPIWEPQTNFLWDPNITPEGGAIQYQKKINDMLTPWAMSAAYVLANNKPSYQDDWMWELQGGLKGNLTDKIYYKTAVEYYDIENPLRTVMTAAQRSQDATNTETIGSTLTQGSYLYNYGSIIGTTAEIGMNDPLGELLDPLSVGLFRPYIPQAGVFGSWVKNTGAPNGDNAAWQIGGYMGNSALNGWGTWRVISAYKVIERDAWMDIFPDYDFYTGDTDVAGWRNEMDIGLMKNVYLGFNVFDTRIYKPFVDTSLTGIAVATDGSSPNSTASHAREVLFQADINIIF